MLSRILKTLPLMILYPSSVLHLPGMLSTISMPLWPLLSASNTVFPKPVLHTIYDTVFLLPQKARRRKPKLLLCSSTTTTTITTSLVSNIRFLTKRLTVSLLLLSSQPLILPTPMPNEITLNSLISTILSVVSPVKKPSLKSLETFLP